HAAGFDDQPAAGEGLFNALHHFSCLVIPSTAKKGLPASLRSARRLGEIQNARVASCAPARVMTYAAQ
ncbi:MAG TPA: hypothetical protein VIV65_07265, partial [Gemmatimonadaceae bacterium]